MNAPMRVVVLSSCTGLKTRDPVLFPDDFMRPKQGLRGMINDLESERLPAERLYRGQHHLRLMTGLAEARASSHLQVDLRIVSAGYGLVRGSDKVVPYECTFQGHATEQRERLVTSAGIPAAVRALLQEDYDLGVVLLGEDYLDACQLDHRVALGGPTLVFCGQAAAVRLPPLDRLRAIPVRRHETRRFGCGLVGLKGEIGGRLLSYLARGQTSMTEVSSPHILDCLAGLGKSSQQIGLPVA
jgi:hypothetical protein